MTLHVIEHPLVAHYLTRLRDRETTPDEFREASDKIITLLLYEAILDPMLATGGTATKAVEIMKEYDPASVRLVCVVAAPEGIQALQAAHPDVQIFTAARDRELNAQKYILPGLGDYGDRLFGT